MKNIKELILKAFFCIKHLHPCRTGC